uniref:Uncharacterized protein n=1 Tax=Prevotella sp. Sc00028 TaxID=1231728 RepID=W5QTE1_9BACT|nr:hypothetical protein [Prevotella sp. Sc00028]
MSIKKNFFAPLALGLGATRRAAMLLLVMMLTTATAWATTFSTINVGGTDYTLFTGFTATDGTAVDNAFVYGNMVDGNLSSSFHAFTSPAYVEFNSDDPIIPKGYIFNTYDASNWKPTGWVLKAKANTADEWTTLSSKSGQSLASGQEFQYACDNNGNNAYKYFRFEVSNSNNNIWLTEIRLYGNMSYTHISVKAATCTETGIKQECWRRTDGKYFTDETGTTELAESDVIAPMIPHTAVHHEATSTNIEYWQCSVCSKFFSDSDCTTEITEAETQTTVFGTLANGCYTLTSQTYTLTEDVNTAGYIYVPEGVTATIDLAGHTIDRGLTSAVANGYVIKVAGTLTLTDSGTGGTVRGGMHDEYISCVYVPDGGTFTLAGGTLIGNTSNEGNRAVYVAFSAHFTMTGGKITGDVCGINASGHLTISGGEISGNSQRGIYPGEYSISISGNPRITGNGDVNVNLYYDDAARLTVTGALTEGASIGITPHGTPTANAPVTVTSGYGTYNTASPDTYFTLDNNSFVLGWNEDRTEVAVGTELYTVGFDMNGHGTAIDAVSVLSGCKLMKPEPTADGWYFVGWFTDADCTAGNEWNFDDAVTSNMTLHALWTQEAIYSFTLPEKMVIVSADQEAVGGKYPVGTNIRFKLSSADYVVDGDVSDGTNALTADGDGIYTVTMGDADITITATIKKAVEPNKKLSGSENYEAQNGDVLTGSTSGTVTIANNAKITLSDVTITGGIVCEGLAEITLVGTNSVTGASQKAGIQVGGSGTTLTIKGNGSLTANGGSQSAGIGLSRAWDVDATGGDIVIEGGNITANGGSQWGAGIGTGVIYGDGSAKAARIGNITIKGGTVKATGGSDSDGIGTGFTYYGCTNTIGTVTIYDGIDMVDASSIKNSGSIVYKHDETDVTASKSDYFTIIENGNRRIIVQKVTPAIADIPDQTYTGSAITPEPTVIAGSLSLTKGTDYVYSYTNNTDAGTATVRATFQGDYASLGYVEKEFKIVKSMTNNDITITIPSQTWTGNELTPVITVKDGENVLTENTDYTVTPPSGPIQDSGNHAYTITGMGNYAGSREAMFTITPYLADQFGAVYVYQDQNGKTALLEGTSVEPVDIPSVINKTVNHVTSNRVFTPGKASTVMLPFDYTCNGEEGGTFYKFVGVKKENDKWVATMQETGNDANNEGTLIANTPYLFMPTATEMTFPNINGSVALSTEGGGNCVTADLGSHWTFKGTYWFKEWNSSNYYDAEEIGRAYGFAGVAKDGINVGDFVRVASGAKIRPMRAYLLWNDMPNAANARALTRGAAATEEELPQSITVRLVGANGQTTAIGTLDTKTGEMTFDSEAWYTLDGVRLNGKPTKKGLYINNGKKIVIK